MGSSSWLSNLSSTITTTTFGNRNCRLLAVSVVSLKKNMRRSWSCSCCIGRDNDADAPLTAASAYAILGLQPNCSSTAEIKTAFRAKVKQFHPDVNRDQNQQQQQPYSDTVIRRIIQAYKLLSNSTPSEIIEERECLDPFDTPECEAFDLFVNQLLCLGKACSNSCVEKAPHAFTFDSSNGTARAFSQGHGEEEEEEDYQVQSAVGQCPKSCIHYVTPSQRILLEELLDSILDAHYDPSAEADLLYSLITKANFENNRYQKPKKDPKFSTQHVDWF